MSKAILAALALIALMGATFAALQGHWWVAAGCGFAVWALCLLLITAIEHKRGGGEL